MRLGLTREYGWSFLRVGHKEISRDVDLGGGRFRPRPFHSGPVLALGDEKLSLEYRIAPVAGSRGRLRLYVLQMFGVGGITWRRTFGRASAGHVEIDLGPAHVYMVGIAYGHFLGETQVDWKVE